jgi:hypothetical protein
MPLWGGVVVSSAKLTLAAVYFATIYMYLRQLANWLVAAGVLVASLVLFGPNWRQIMAIIDATARFLSAALPSTRVGWGIVGIATSFALLGIGLMISLRKPPDQHQGTTVTPPLPEPTAQALPSI